MTTYNIQILGITETHLIRNDPIIYDSHKIILSSNQMIHRNGVGLVMSKVAADSLMEQKSYNDRLLYARFKTKFINISVIVAYAPTNS